MISGMNIRMNIWRIEFPIDDEVGGAVVTGTLVYRNVRGRLEEAKPQMLLLQQGLEIPRIFTAHVVPATLIIKERDEVEVSVPTDHSFYGKRMVVRGVETLSMRPSDHRAYTVLSLSKKDFSHAD
jgi:hypothetical protein